MTKGNDKFIKKTQNRICNLMILNINWELLVNEEK